jgi:hypothetical protein
VSADDKRKDAQTKYLAALGARFADMQSVGKIQNFARLDFGYTLQNGTRVILDFQHQKVFTANDGSLWHGMARERAEFLGSLGQRVLVVVAETPPRRGGEYTVLRQWLDVLNETGDPWVLKGGNVVWRREAFSLDEMPWTSTRVKLKPLGEEKP